MEIYIHRMTIAQICHGGEDSVGGHRADFGLHYNGVFFDDCIGGFGEVVVEDGDAVDLSGFGEDVGVGEEGEAEYAGKLSLRSPRHAYST